MENKTVIYLDDEEIELFKKFRQYQNIWEKFFDKKFIGSLTLHGKNGELMENEWKTREKVIHNS